MASRLSNFALEKEERLNAIFEQPYRTLARGHGCCLSCLLVPRWKEKVQAKKWRCMTAKKRNQQPSEGVTPALCSILTGLLSFMVRFLRVSTNSFAANLFCTIPVVLPKLKLKTVCVHGFVGLAFPCMLSSGRKVGLQLEFLLPCRMTKF